MSKDRARLIVLEDMPAPCMGAPIPFVVSNEIFLGLCYHVDNSIQREDGKRTNAQDEDNGVDSLAVVRFFGTHAHYFGAPGEEENHSHPLFDGVRNDWTCVYELITDHPVSGFNLSRRFGQDAGIRHLIFPFHASTFEVLATDYDVSVYKNLSAIDAITKKLREWSDE